MCAASTPKGSRLRPRSLRRRHDEIHSNQHQFYCGIDRHANSMDACVLGYGTHALLTGPSSHVVCYWFPRCCAESSLEWLPSSEPVRSRVSDWFGFLCVKVSMEMLCAVVSEDAGIH